VKLSQLTSDLIEEGHHVLYRVETRHGALEWRM